MKNYLYIKMLYSCTQEYNMLKKLLLQEKCSICSIKKKELLRLGIMQTFNVYMVVSNESMSEQEFDLLKVKLNKIELIQVLGVIRNKVLLVDSAYENKNFIPGICKVFVFSVLIKSFLVYSIIIQVFQFQNRLKKIKSKNDK